MAIGLIWTIAFLIGFVTLLVYDRMGGFHSKPEFPVAGRTVMVTGGSQGMGKALACRLAKKGASVVIVARSVQPLQEAVKEISAMALIPGSQRFHYISADLTSPTASSDTISAATAWNNEKPPDIVFCCAGYSHPGLFADVSPDVLKDEMEGNYFSAAYTAHAAIRAWLASSAMNHNHVRPDSELPEAKHIIFTSSLVAFLPLVGYAPYTPTKTALRALSDTLSQELLLYAHHTPMRSHVVFPGTIYTASYDRENLSKPAVTKKLEEADGGQTPDDVARKTIEGLEAGEELVVTSGLLGMAMRSGMLGSSIRGGWLMGTVNTLLGWVCSIVLVFVRMEMDRTVKSWWKNSNSVKTEKETATHSA